MKKIFRKFICAFLVLVCLIFINTQTYAIAETLEPTETESDIVCELSARRDAFTKCFALQDGNYMYVIYPYQVNYNSGDFWEEIDNTLIEHEGIISNEFEDFSIAFSSDINADSLVKIESNGSTIQWSLDAFDTNGNFVSKSPLATAEIQEHKTDRALTHNDSIIYDTKNTSALVYKNAYSSTGMIDIEYKVLPYALKENVILYQPSNINTIAYSVKADGLIPRLNADNSITFLNKDGTAAYTFAKPVAYDAEDEYTYDIAVRIVSDNNSYKVYYSLDNEWLGSSERVYPVVIDPTIISSNESTNYEDTYVSVGDTAGAHNSEIKMRAGNKNSLDYRAYLRIKQLPMMWDLRHITLVSAKLKLFLPSATSTVNPVDIYQVDGSWAENTICYSSQPSSVLLQSNVNINNSNNNKTVVFNVVPYINYYLTSGSNNGFMIKYSDDTINDYNAFYTSNYSDSDYYPVLTVVTNTNYESESNDSIEQADEVTTDNEPGVIVKKYGTLSTVTDVDYYKFVPERQGVYVFELISPTGYNYSTKFYQLAPGASSPVLVTPVSTINGCNAFFVQKGTNTEATLSEYYIKVYTTGSSVSSNTYRLNGYYSDEFANLDWQYPLPSVWYRLSSAVGFRTYNNKFHKGIDIPASAGTQIRSVCAGTVKASGWDPDGVMGYYVRIKSSETSNYPVANS